MKSKQPVKFIETKKVYREWGTENILMVQIEEYKRLLNGV